MAVSDAPFRVLAPFALGTATTAPGSDEVVVLHGDGSVRALPLEIVPPRGLFDLLQGWPAVEQQVTELDVEALPRLEDVEVLAPILYPRKVICIAANHRDHLAEVGADVEQAIANWQPFFFMKAPTTSVVGPLDSVQIPSVVEDARLDWEGELGAVLGRHLKGGSPEEARDAIAGYVPLNDLTTRGALVRQHAMFDPVRYDWVGAKSFDGALPMGPGMVPAALVADPLDLDITVTVDGEVMQHGSTAGLVSNVYEAVAAASRIMTLEPGDVIATGTPGGVGSVRGLQLNSGSSVTVEIEAVGSLTTRIV